MTSEIPEKHTALPADVEKPREPAHLEDVPAALGMSEDEFRRVEKRVIRKLDFSVVPLVMAMYLLAFLDRSNIG